jgi:hypothetical protein
MDERLASACAVTGLIFGGLVAVFNLFLAYIRPSVIRALGWPERNVSGVPMIGSLLLVPATIYFAIDWRPWLFAAGVLLNLMDLGGVFWFLVSLLMQLTHDGRESEGPDDPAAHA